MKANGRVLYEQLAQEIKKYIQQQKLVPGDRLPSISALCEMFSVSHITVGTAFKLLRDEGVLESRRRSGVFVSQPRIKSTFDRHQKILALLIPFGDHPFEARIIRGVMEAAQAAGYQVIMANNNDDPEIEAKQLRELASKAAALLVMPVMRSPNYAIFAELQDQKIPLVFIDRYVAGIEAPVVATDNEQGGYLVTRHLLDIGHRHIYMLGTAGVTATQERIDGYRRALREYGVPFDSTLVRPSTPEMDAQLYDLTRQLLQGDLPKDKLPLLAGYSLTQQLLQEQTPREFAILTVNDETACSCYAAIQEAGLRVPEDVSLAGYDDQQPVMGGPSLTTVRQHPRRMGGVAVDVLLSILGGSRKALQGARITPELIVRGSTHSARGKQNSDVRGQEKEALAA